MYTLLSCAARAQGALALLGEPSADAAGATAMRGTGATRRFGPGGLRRALTGRVAALEPYIQERCGRTSANITFLQLMPHSLRVNIETYPSHKRNLLNLVRGQRICEGSPSQASDAKVFHGYQQPPIMALSAFAWRGAVCM